VPAALDAIAHAIAEGNRYPDGGCYELRQALAKRHDVAYERIVVGNGVDGVLNYLALALLEPGDEVSCCWPSFPIYRIDAAKMGASSVTAPLAGSAYDLQALLETVNERTKMVFVANPNNPTGTYVTRDEMLRLHAGLPSSVLLVIDAAYAEFVTRNDYEPGVELVDAAPNVVMARTFSKIYALGGLRLGWVYCSAAVADVLNRVRNPFNVNAAAQAAGIAALEDVQSLERAREHNAVWRPWLERELAGLGVEVQPSVANFVLARFPAGAKNAEAAFAFLQSRAILTRKVGGYGLPDCLRITVGTEAEMRAVRDAVAAFMTAS
jgi:histidinol-phosphate aminotransferase